MKDIKKIFKTWKKWIFTFCTRYQYWLTSEKPCHHSALLRLDWWAISTHGLLRQTRGGLWASLLYNPCVSMTAFTCSNNMPYNHLIVVVDMLRLAVLNHFNSVWSTDDECQKTVVIISCLMGKIKTSFCVLQYPGEILTGMWEAVVLGLVSILLCASLLFGWIGYLRNNSRVKMDWLFREWNYRPLKEAKNCWIKQN